MNRMPNGWRMEEPGWWIHDGLGGVCRERDGKWYGYPKHIPESSRLGPFRTAVDAAMSLPTRDASDSNTSHAIQEL